MCNRKIRSPISRLRHQYLLLPWQQLTNDLHHVKFEKNAPFCFESCFQIPNSVSSRPGASGNCLWRNSKESLITISEIRTWGLDNSALISLVKWRFHQYFFGILFSISLEMATSKCTKNFLHDTILLRNWSGEKQPLNMFHKVYCKQYIRYTIRICLGHVKFSKIFP